MIKTADYHPGMPTPRGKKCIDTSKQLAAAHGQNAGPNHFLLAIMLAESGCAQNVLHQLHPDMVQILTDIAKDEISAAPKEEPTETGFSEVGRKVLSTAAKEAKALQHAYIGTEHLFLAVRKVGSGADAFFNRFGLTLEFFRESMLHELDPNHPAPRLQPPPKEATKLKTFPVIVGSIFLLIGGVVHLGKKLLKK